MAAYVNLIRSAPRRVIDHLGPARYSSAPPADLSSARRDGTDEGTGASGAVIALVVTACGDDYGFEGVVSRSARGEIGTVAINGSTFSADDLTTTDSADLCEQSGSFEFRC